MMPPALLKAQLSTNPEMEVDGAQGGTIGGLEARFSHEIKTNGAAGDQGTTADKIK